MSNWQPLDITTPEAWNRFFARQIGGSAWGCAAAISFHALYFGIQIIGRNSREARGIALALGPLWLGVARLRHKEQQP